MNTERAWALTEDVGERLDARLKQDPDVAHLLLPMRGYAASQRLLSGHAEDLLALGVPDARPENIPALFENVVAHAPSGMLDPEVVAKAEAKPSASPPRSTTRTCTRATSSARAPTRARSTGETPASPTPSARCSSRSAPSP